MTKTSIFDIETGALARDRIEEIAPEFKESSVKTGNLGLDKALEKINLERSRHIQNIVEKAALKAEYGQVLAVGIMTDDVATILHGDEKKILSSFWEMALAALRSGGSRFVGFNCLNFDLPFLLRRSLLNDVPVPRDLRPFPRYWPTIFVDLMEVWKAGDYREMISLDRFCKAAGLNGKNGDGANFQKLYEENQEEAIAYLENDLLITQSLASKILPLLS